MKAFWGLIILLLFTPSLAVAFTFTQNLRMGSVGPEVLELQRFLNQDSDTKVSEAGPGSSGNETSFFGRATYRAVVKFQEKYRQEVLFPASLYQGTGFVGPLTRGKLAMLANIDPLVRPPFPIEVPAQVVPQQPTSLSPVLPLQTESVVPSSPTNPNLENMEWYINTLKRVGKEKGFNDSKLATIEEYVRAVAATTTDFKGQFLKEVKIAQIKQDERLAQASKYNPNPFVRIALSVVNEFKKLVPTAEALIGVPFGGRLIYTFPCTCSGAWSVGLIGTAPTYAAILDYEIGTQMYGYYTAPFALNFLGDYISGVPACWEYVGVDCIDMPSYGLMTGTLGTSI